MHLDKFYIYELAHSVYSTPSAWYLSLDDTFELSEREKIEKNQALNYLIIFYNNENNSNFSKNIEVLEDFIDKVNNDNPICEKLVSVIYYILFYNYIDKSLILKLNEVLITAITEWCNFFLETQYRNIINIQSIKSEHERNMKEKFKKHYQELNEEATNDTLTWIYNRRALVQILPKISSLITRNTHNKNNRRNKKYAAILLDLDHFKSINDNLWHDIWDLTLVEFVEIINKAIRDTDYFIRIWWDEFLLIVEIWSIKDLEELCNKLNEKVRKWLNNHYFRKLYVDLETPIPPEEIIRWKFITTSIWATFIKKEELLDKNWWDKVFKRADEAVYKSKWDKELNNWRDRYTIY